MLLHTKELQAKPMRKNNDETIAPSGYAIVSDTLSQQRDILRTSFRVILLRFVNVEGEHRSFLFDLKGLLEAKRSESTKRPRHSGRPTRASNPARDVSKTSSA
jgi:hypothetical protein